MLPRLWGNADSPYGNVTSGSLEENGTGKFSDIDASSIDYVKWLGFSHIWLTGVIRHATADDNNPQIVKGNAGSPYAITDYYDVNPYLAENPDNRMSEFDALVTRIHDAGLKVIIDFIPNHVSRDYRGDLGKNDDTSVHWSAENDFFYYPGETLKLPVDGDWYEYPAKASGNCFSSAPSINDWYETIKLNYCDFHTGTWEKMRDIVLFWAGRGVDGFRCDMVELVPPEFFRWMIASVKKEYPQLLFVAEVYDKCNYAKYINEAGFDLLYDKSGLYDTLRAVLCNGTPAKSISENWQTLGELQDHMLNFLENHDEQRIASSNFAGNGRKGLSALAVSLLFARGDFMLYFGQEIGENASYNEGFSGKDGRTSIFDWWNIQSIRDLRKAIEDGSYKEMSVNSLVSSGLSVRQAELMCRYAAALHLATSEKPLPYDLSYCNPSSDHLFAFLRGACTLIVCNFSSEKSRTKVTVPSEAFRFYGVNRESESISVVVPANDFSIVELK